MFCAVPGGEVQAEEEQLGVFACALDPSYDAAGLVHCELAFGEYVELQKRLLDRDVPALIWFPHDVVSFQARLGTAAQIRHSHVRQRNKVEICLCCAVPSTLRLVGRTEIVIIREDA